MSGMRFTPKGYGGHRRNPDEVKRDGWKEQGLLAVAIDDDRLEHELLDIVVAPKDRDREQSKPRQLTKHALRLL